MKVVNYPSSVVSVIFGATFFALYPSAEGPAGEASSAYWLSVWYFIGSAHYRRHSDLPVTIPLLLGLGAGVSLGRNSGSPVMTDYGAPFAFTGTVKKAFVDISGETIEDMAAKIRMYLARQ